MEVVVEVGDEGEREETVCVGDKGFISIIHRGTRAMSIGP